MTVCKHCEGGGAAHVQFIFMGQAGGRGSKSKMLPAKMARGVVKGRLPLWGTILTMVVIIRGGGGHVGDYSLDVS